MRRRQFLQGLLVAAIAVGLVALVGPGRVVTTLAAVPPEQLALVAVAGLTPVVVWGGSLAVAMGALGIEAGFWRAVAGFTAVSFCNLVTPFGQTGGDPPAGAVIARGFGCSFESGLTAVGAVNLCNRIAATALGLAALATTAGGANATASLILSVAGLAAIPVAWWLRRPAVEAGVAVLAALAAPLARLDRLDVPTRSALRARGERLLDALDRLRRNPLRLAALFGLGVVGQLLVASTLWLALIVVGARVSPAVVVVAVPVAKLGAVVPTPGGTGGVEAGLTAVIVAAGVATPAAAAGVVCYRVAAFWLPSALGGLATGWLVTPTAE